MTTIMALAAGEGVPSIVQCSAPPLACSNSRASRPSCLSRARHQRDGERYSREHGADAMVRGGTRAGAGSECGSRPSAMDGRAQACVARVLRQHISIMQCHGLGDTLVRRPRTMKSPS